MFSQSTKDIRNFTSGCHPGVCSLIQKKQPTQKFMAMHIEDGDRQQAEHICNAKSMFTTPRRQTMRKMKKMSNGNLLLEEVSQKPMNFAFPFAVCNSGPAAVMLRTKTYFKLLENIYDSTTCLLLISNKQTERCRKLQAHVFCGSTVA